MSGSREEGVKRCPDCGKDEPVSQFTRDKRRWDGLSFYCRNCRLQRERTSLAKRRGRPPMLRRAVDIDVPADHKWCPDCDRVKPLEEFPRNRNTPNGRAVYCKPCHNARGRAALEKVGGARTYHLKRRYGVRRRRWRRWWRRRVGGARSAGRRRPSTSTTTTAPVGFAGSSASTATAVSGSSATATT